MAAPITEPIVCAGCGDLAPQLTPGARCDGCGDDPTVSGRWALLCVLGRGSVSTTWEGRALRDGARVVLKELPLRAAPQEREITLFKREAEMLRQLDHPAIPRLIELVEVRRGRRRALWQVREHVEGRDLLRELQHHRYTVPEVLDILDELLAALTYLHGLCPPVIHRDLKPANVVRRASDGRLMLVDLGSVRDVLVDDDVGGSTVAGTFGYMAPEQFRGDCGPMSDLYGIGALAVHLLTRREPHTLLTPSGRLAWEQHARVDLPTLALLSALLEPDAERRPRQADAVRQWLGSVRRAPQLPLLPVPAPRHLPATTGASMVRSPPSWHDALPVLGVVMGLATSMGILATLLAALVALLSVILL